MVCNPQNKFAFIQHWGQTNVMQRIEQNVRDFYSWAFLCIGAWKNIGLSNGTWASLQPVDCGTHEGLAFGSMRKDWVWETVEYTDLNGSGITPNVPAIYVGGVLQASGYEIDYPNGIVYFDSAPAGEVTASYSFKNVQVYVASDVGWWRELQQLSWAVDDNHFSRCDTGDYSIGAWNRVQMPTIIIKAGDADNSPAGLGDCGQKRRQEIIFDVFAETDRERDNIVDIILNENDRDLLMYDPDEVYLNSAYPIGCQGELQNANSYPDLVESYPWGCIRMQNARQTSSNDLRCGLYEGMVRAEFETIFSSL